MRINKYLANRGVASRRRIDELVERKKVLINGAIARVGDKVDDQKDTVQFGKKIFAPSTTARKYEHWMVYKPAGYVSTTSDPTGKPVITSLVKSKQRLYPVGRLDVDSEGLMILTNDGKLTNRLTHPSHHIPKTYRVWVTGKLSRNGLNQIRRGMKMKHFKVAPAEVSIIEKEDNSAVLEIILHQGLNRQVRRMMKSLNLRVKKLKRVAVGSLGIGRLRPGQSILLTKEDLELFFS